MEQREKKKGLDQNKACEKTSCGTESSHRSQGDRRSSFSLPKISANITSWMATDSDETKEFVIQAEVPKSQVHFSSNFGPLKISHISPHSQSIRVEDILSQLFRSIKEIVDQAVLLKTACAVAIKANPRQLQRVSKLPNIREILPNRNLIS